tara:strand:+ start:10725 stop:11651 length:927 start_codon:yes stop_codon:yes gene_type:complete
MNSVELPVCPYCKSEDYSELTPAGLQCSGFSGLQNYVQPEFWARSCSNCKLVFKSRILDESSLDDYYSSTKYAKWESHRFYPTERHVLRLANQLSEGKRLLDIGCSSGRLLHELIHKHSCFGIEPNIEAAKAAEGKGIHIVTSEELRLGRLSPFDAVFLMDVYEHLREPRELLASIWSNLKAGGRIFIATGNSNASSLRRDLANSWYLQNVEHLIMASPGHFAAAAEDIGFEIESSFLCSHYDANLRMRVEQICKQLAFNLSRNENGFCWRYMFRKLPLLNRAESWPRRPPCNLGKDHFVTSLLKPNI